MATLASLNIALTADSAKLKKDLGKAGAATKKWSGKQKKDFEGVTKAIRGMGIALGAVGGIAALRGLSLLATEVINLANLTNMSTVELQRLQPALTSIGMSTEKYSDILKDVNDKMHDFMQTGAGPMVDFFEQIAPKVGITADAFKDLSGEDALQLYVKSLEDANLSQEQMTFYMEAIASDSTMLLPLLRNNAAEMARFGLATHQVIDEGVLSDLKSLGVQMQAITVIVRNAITNALWPLISVLADAVEGWRQLITQAPVILRVLGAIGSAIGLLTVYMLANPIMLWISAISLLIVGVGFLAKKFFELAEVVGGVGVLFGLMKDAAVFEFKQIGAAVNVLGLKMALIFNDIQDKWNNTIHKMSMTLARWLDSVAASGAGQLLGFDGGNEEATAAGYSNRMKALTDEFVDLSGRLYDAQALSGAENPHMQQITAGMGEAWGEDPKATISDAVEAGVVAAIAPTGGGGVTPVDEGAKSIIDKSWAASIADDFSGTLKSELSNALATGDWSDIGDVLMDQLTSSIIDKAVGGAVDWGMSLLGFADGGIVPSTPNSKSYADSVPAMLQPGELVVPVDQVGNFLNGGGSGGGQTFNINVTGDVSRLTRTEIVKMMPEIAAGTNMLNKESGR